MKNKSFYVILNTVLLLLGVVTVFPFVWMLLSSFKNNSEICTLNQSFIPKIFTFDNYVSMQTNFDFLRFFGNSLFLATATTVIIVYTSTICGFVLSKYEFKGRKLIFAFVLSTMMIPWAVTIIPKYTMIESFGWMDSYLAIIVPGMFSGFGIFMMKQQIETIPNDIIEAA